MIDFHKVGIKITTYRKNLNMTQDDLANQLFVTRQALSKWENGTSIPSIDTVIELSRIFKTSIDNILCLDDDHDITIDKENIFGDYQRSLVISKILKKEIVVDIPSVLYQFSNHERMIILKAVKEKRLVVNLEELRVRLTPSEQKYLFKSIVYKGEIIK